jgi:hypothetical protein
MKKAKTFLNKAGQHICDLIEEALYGDQLAVSRAHQAVIDEIASQPVPYALTPRAEAALEDAGQEAQQ